MEVRPGYKQTEVGVIPEEWEVTPLRSINFDISDGNYSSKYPKASDFRPFGIPFIRANNIQGMTVVDDDMRFISSAQHQELQKGHLKANDLLITTRGDIGQVAIVPEHHVDSNINAQLVRINTGNTGVDHRFLVYAMSSESAREQLKNLQTGSALKQLPVERLIQLQLIFPSPPEQRAIATALSDVDALLGGLDRLIDKKRDIKQGTMQQLLTGQTRLPGFHGEWESVEFGDIACIRNAKIVLSSTPAGTQCVELDSIDQGTGRLLMSIEAKGLSSKYSFRRGDVLFGRLRAYLRKYWLAAFDGVCSTEIWPLIACDDRLSGDFLHLLVQTNDFVNAAGVSYGTHMPRSDWSVLKHLPVRLPPFPEQTAIAAVLSNMDAELSALEARRNKTRDLKQAMMQELLSGNTRLVPVSTAEGLRGEEVQLS